MLRIITALAFCGLLSLLATEYANTSSGGPPPNHTGAPNQGNCTACHGGTVNSGPATRTLVFDNNPNLTSYVPGQTYTAVLTINQSGISTFGFQMISRNANNSNVGTFVATNANQTQVSSGYFQHTAGGITATTAGTKSWSFSWTAPAVGTGTVSFYVATNAADGTGGTSGDVIYTNVFTLTEAAAAPSVNAATVTQTAVCRGSNISVNFTTSANFNAGNTFTVQLSDANGSFTNPTNIGTLNATAPAQINATTPSNAAGGTGYRVRVVASNPVSTGTQSSPFTITEPAAAPSITFDGRTLTASGSGVYTWLFNGNPISGATTATYVPIQAGNYTAGIVNNGCSPSLSTPFTVNAGLLSITNPNIATFCEGSFLLVDFVPFGSFTANNTFSLELLSSNNTVTPLPSGGSGNSIGGSLPAGVTGSGYRYRVRSSDPVAVSALSSAFTIAALPITPIIQQTGSTISVTNQPAGTTVVWSVNGQVDVTLTGPTITPTQNGQYTARYSSTCLSANSNAIIVTGVSVQEQVLAGLKWYPNPANEQLNLVAETEGVLHFQNLHGQTVMKKTLEAGKHYIDLSTLAPGIYLLGWETATGISYERLVKN